MGTQLPHPPKNGTTALSFRPMCTVAKRLRDATWYGAGFALTPGDIVLDGTQLPHERGTAAPQFSAHVHCGQTVAHLSNCRALVLFSNDGLWCSGASIQLIHLRSIDTSDAWETDVTSRTKTKFGERGFCFAGPVVWNRLPPHLHRIGLITDSF